MGSLKLVIVEFGYLDIKEGYQSLWDLCNSAISQISKLWIFRLVLKQILKLHKVKIAHLCLNPEKIWIKGNFKHSKTVYLSPFIVDFENPDDSTSDIWYTAPEFLFNSPDFHNRIESDIWSIGCILYELYSSPSIF